MAMTFAFDPDRVAHFEAAGWRAYYDRQWFRLLWLTHALCQEQFRIPFPRSLLAAYAITRASLAWAPLDHDLAAVRDYLDRFYRLARRHSGLRFDPARVGALELQYFDVHRRLAGQEDKAELIQTLTDLHAAIFGLSPGAARESAVWRVRAMNTVDGITGGHSTDIEGDWAALEGDLRGCYRTIARELGAAESAPAVSARSTDYHLATDGRLEGLRLALARRRARTPEERARIPEPRGPLPAPSILPLAGAAVAAGLLYLGARRLARRSSAAAPLLTCVHESRPPRTQSA